MKKILKKLKTSDKIIFLFTLINFIGLLLLLLAINITYFFIWYSDQKKESLYDINKNYSAIVGEKKLDNIEAFKKYILKKNTIIISEKEKKLICSDGVAKTLHNNQIVLDKIKDSFYYISDGKIYFIFSKKYPKIGEVKVFFDTTPYVKSQIIIIKISLFIIFISLFIFYFIGKKITKYSFKNLEKIAKKAKEFDIEKDFKKIKIIGNKDDEINILADIINNSYFHVKKQTNNLKQFITDVSHEFKTPLMVINSQIDLYNKKLERNKLNENDIKNLLKNIKHKTKKLNNLLETFLLLGRIENKVEKLQKQKLNISDYIKEFTLTFIKNNEYIKSIGDENLEIKFNIKNNIYKEININTFNILFGNILSNAIKFSKDNLLKKEKIKIEIGLDEKKIYIKDNGIGIKKEDLKNIFKKFSRINRNVEGFGVGLFLVKRLVDLYNCKLKVESKYQNGTKFIIYF